MLTTGKTFQIQQSRNQPAINSGIILHWTDCRGDDGNGLSYTFQRKRPRGSRCVVALMLNRHMFFTHKVGLFDCIIASFRPSTWIKLEIPGDLTEEFDCGALELST
jgi:hypothetical protein